MFATFLWIALVGSCPASMAQDAVTDAPKPATPSAPDFAALIKAAEDNVELDDTLKAQLLDAYKQARKQFGAAKEWRDKTAEQNAWQASAPDKIAEMRAQLAEPVATPTIEVPADAGLQQLQRLLSDAEAAVKSARDQSARVDEERKNRNERRSALRTSIETLKNDLETLPKETIAEEGELELMTQARALVLDGNRAALAEELAALESEWAGFDLRADFLSARRDILSREISSGEAVVAQWQELVSSARKKEEEEASRKAAQISDIAMEEGVVKQAAEANVALAEQRAEAKLSELIKQADADLEALRDTLHILDSLSTTVRSKVEKAGLTQTMGQLLRRRLDDLPDLRRHRVHLGTRKREIAEFEVDLIDLDTAETQLTNVDLRVREHMKEVDATLSEDRRNEIAEVLKQLLIERREMVDSFGKDCDLYIQKLYELNALELDLIDHTELTRAFINERILWIRSAAWPSRLDFQHAAEAIAWLVNRENLALVAPTAWQTVIDRPGWTLFFVTGLIAMGVAKPHLRRTIKQVAEEARRPSCQRFLPTLRSTWCTLFDSAMWPGLLWLSGWLLGSRLDCPVYCKDISDTMDEIAYTWLFIAFLRRACATNGLCTAHCNWNTTTSAFLRVCLGRIVLWILPPAFAATIFMNMPNEAWHSSLGRFFFIITHVFLGVALLHMLRPDSPIILEARKSSPPGWPLRYRPVLLMIGGLFSFGIGAASVYGYHYTADTLGLRMWWSIMLITASIILRDLSLRWLLVSRRRIAIEEYRKRREANRGNEEAAEQTEEDPETTAARLTSINDQSIRLVRSGIFAIVIAGLYWTWIDLFPALRLLNEVHLWTHDVPVIVDGIATAAVEAVPVTLGDALLTIVLLTVTLVAARNLPGLLEITVLTRLPLKHGERYAISTVMRYIIIILGIAGSFRQIGIGWSNVQWMAAAITFGLGFGLQEIFANFVSGLILLFERPIRVGDTVTVGADEGTVTHIQMRSTTVLNWNRKEVIIPNREFVTGRITNWSLKDPVLRVVVPVGVAYGTDPERVRYALLKCAREQPGVLSDPEPQALFLGFGDSALSFELRVFISCADTSALMTKHELHMSIARNFEECDIEIAFPQRDLHIRSLPDGHRISMDDGGGTDQAPDA